MDSSPGKLEIRFCVDPDAIRSVTEGRVTKAGARRKSKRSVTARLRYALEHGDHDSNGRFHMPMRMLVDGRDVWSCGGREHLPVDDDGVVDGVQRLAWGHAPEHPWRWVPLVHWAKHGLRAVERIPREGIAWVQDDGGGMRFALTGDLATVEWYPGLDRTWWYPDACAPMRRRPCAPAFMASGSYEELRDVWARFSAEVRTELLTHIPEIADDRVYSDWFPHPAYGWG